MDHTSSADHSNQPKQGWPQLGLLSIVKDSLLHYGIMYHVRHPCLLFSYINMTMQIIYIKGTTDIYIMLIKYQINLM